MNMPISFGRSAQARRCSGQPSCRAGGKSIIRIMGVGNLWPITLAFLSGIAAGITGNVYTDRYTSSTTATVSNIGSKQIELMPKRTSRDCRIDVSSSVVDSWLTGEDHYNVDPERYGNAMEASP